MIILWYVLMTLNIVGAVLNIGSFLFFTHSLGALLVGLLNVVTVFILFGAQDSFVYLQRRK